MKNVFIPKEVEDAVSLENVVKFPRPVYVYSENEIVGVIIYDSEYWIFITDWDIENYENSEECLSTIIDYIIKEYPNYTFKVTY